MTPRLPRCITKIGIGKGRCHMPKLVTIGRIAERTGASVQAVRFYERRKLLNPARRTPKGYRLYEEDDVVRRILFIRGAQEFGFSLVEIGRLIKMGKRGGDNCSLMRAMLLKKIEDFGLEVRSITGKIEEMREFIAECDHPEARKRGICPVMERFARKRAATETGGGQKHFLKRY